MGNGFNNISRAEVLALREIFPTGTEVVCDSLNDEYHPVAPGTHGIVKYVDDIGTIHVNWKTGSTLGIAYGVDRCHKAAGEDR